MELLTLHTGGWHDEEEDLRDDLPSGRVPGRASDPPDLGTMVAAATEGFVDILSGNQGFCIGGFL